MFWQNWLQFTLRKETKKKKIQHWATQVVCEKLQLMYLDKWKEQG